ncbi:MAG: hypothetical protein ACK4UN_21350, partial [Limisphaerales bacterium]
MEIKVLCGCGAKFAFDVEPVNGQMPVAINCPKCSADVTANANEIIAQRLAEGIPQDTSSAPVSPGPAPKTRLKVSGATHTPAASNAPTAPAASETASSGMCNRHLKNAAASNCFVCGKPICLECMSQFGYLCSVGCKYQAEQQGLKVPNYKFQSAAVQNRFWQKVGMLSGLIALLILGLIAAAVWYEFSGSHPKAFYSLKYGSNQGPIHTQFIGKNEVLLLFRDKLMVHDIKEKRDLWSVSLNEASSNEGNGGSSGNLFGSGFRWRPQPKMHL